MKNCLTPKKSENVRPLVTLLKMRPHYSQSSRANATPSSGTFSLASYMEVNPPRGGGLIEVSLYLLTELYDKVTQSPKL